MNEKDGVNYLIESNSHNEEIFKMGLKKKNLNLQQSEILFEDTDNKYIESSNKLLDSIINSLDYFKRQNDLSFKNEDKVQTIKILKEDYEKMKIEYETLINENNKLKEKNKNLKENSYRGNQSGNSENINVNKFIDSLMFLQNKNEDLEKENKNMKNYIDELKERLKIEKKKKMSSDSGIKNKSVNINTNRNTSSKVKQDHMESLLKEQIYCMKKMLVIVQDGKENTTTSSAGVGKKKITGTSQNDYLDSDSVSHIHFEESFNVTNLSNSDYSPEHEKDYDNKNSNSTAGQKFEILLKPFEKSKKKIENAVDDDVQKIPQSHSSAKNNYMGSNISLQSGKSKQNVSSNFTVNYPKMNKRLGDFSHRGNK